MSEKAKLIFIYDKAHKDDFSSITIRVFAKDTKDNIVWKGTEITLREGDTLTLNGLSIVV